MGCKNSKDDAANRDGSSDNVITFAILKGQDDKTSNAILQLLGEQKAFKSLSRSEGDDIIKRDSEDEKKLAVGIEIAVKKGVLEAEPKVSEIKKIDVVGKTSDAVADEIMNQLPGKEGNVVILQGLSGTGKGTTVKKLQALLPDCVCWSNGNVFRTLTHLTSKKAEEDGVEFSAEFLTAELLAATVDRLKFEKCDDGTFDVIIDGTERVSTIQNTVLKQPHISSRVPTVAEQTQGEVVKFAAGAVATLTAAGKNVILEGRAQTLNHIATDSRFELVIADSELLGSRRAAQRVMAAALNKIAADTTDDVDVNANVIEAAKELAPAA